jgi:Protein of unknown function (DUF2393)
VDGPIEPSSFSQEPFSQEKRESNLVPIGLGIAFVVLVVGIIAWIERSQPKIITPPPAYAANLKFSDLKLSTAQDFVGSTVTYLDGTITNAGDRTVSHIVVQVIFQDSTGAAQLEDVPLLVLKTAGPSRDAVDLNISPLLPGQSQSFRLTFEHVSDDWNRTYPGLRVSDVVTK